MLSREQITEMREAVTWAKEEGDKLVSVTPDEVLGLLDAAQRLIWAQDFCDHQKRHGKKIEPERVLAILESDKVAP